MRRIALFCSFTLLLAACGGEPVDTAAHGAACTGDGITASDAWMRSARAGQPTSAAYLTLCNGGEADDRLIAARFEGAGATELHMTMMNDENMASMSPTEGIALAAGASVALEPGGAHIMLIGLADAIEAGDAPTLTLEFENAPPATIVFEVREEMSGEHGHH